MYGFNMLVAPFLACVVLIIHVYLLVYFCHQASLQDGVSQGFITIHIHKTQDPLLGACLLTLVSSVIQFNGSTNTIRTYICYICLYKSLCLFTSMFSSLCCLSVCHALLVLCDVFFFYCTWQMEHVPYFQKASKRVLINKYQGFSPSKRFILSLAIRFELCPIAFLDQGSFLTSCFGPHLLAVDISTFSLYLMKIYCTCFIL